MDATDYSGESEDDWLQFIWNLIRTRACDATITYEVLPASASSVAVVVEKLTPDCRKADSRGNENASVSLLPLPRPPYSRQPLPLSPTVRPAASHPRLASNPLPTVSSKPVVTFYYDVISPWSLFAYRLLQRYEKPWNLDVQLRPRYLGGVMQGSGNKPPALVINKGIYMREFDMPMASKNMGVPYRFPKVFPVNTIHSIRFLRVVEDKAPEKVAPLTEIFFEQMWGLTSDSPAAAKPENFRGFIPTSLISDKDLAEWIALSQTTENKDRVKGESDALVESGAFGFPWMVVTKPDGESANFFGSDRFESMASFLGAKYAGPFPEGRANL